jgi:hypothetical protein
MLTKTEFFELFTAGETDKINEAYSQATPDEQRQYMVWLNEAKPADIPEEDDPLAVAGEVLAEPEVIPSEIASAIEDAVASLMSVEADAPNAREVAAHKRAQRSNMLRSIRSKFRLMQPFTITECAQRIGRDPQEVAAYLVSEIRRGTGTFKYNKDKRQFFLDNPFA